MKNQKLRLKVNELEKNLILISKVKLETLLEELLEEYMKETTKAMLVYRSHVKRLEKFTHEHFVVGKIFKFLLIISRSSIEKAQNLHLSKPSCIKNSIFLYKTIPMHITDNSVSYESCHLIIHNS